MIFLLWITLAAALAARATIGVEFQMLLGNPSGAASDPANHAHYLFQRPQYALDYNATTHEPNWASWHLTATDIGDSGRSNFAVDPDLPAGFRRVLTTDYVGSGFDRGHMCPSADRTVTTADNQVTFYMSNMVPQTPDNNQGVWANFETYCRTLANGGNEVLLISGPSGFAGTTIASGVAVPGFTWKIAVIVPLGPGSARDRITAATRVIALEVPNVQGIRSNPWQTYVTSVAEIEADTGYTFFTELPPAIANALRTRVDGAEESAGAVAWDFASVSATSLPDAITASPLSQHNNNGTTPLLTSTSASSGYTGASGGNNAGASARTGPLVLAPNGSAYFEFTLTPDAGRQLHLTALAFGSRSTSTGPQAYAIFSNLDNFTTPIASGTLANNSAWARHGPDITPLTGPPGGAVTLRIYGHSGTGSAPLNTANWRIDDLVITAQASAPTTTAARLINLSSRTRITSDEIAIAGFAIGGTEAKPLLIRAAGPALTNFGVTDALAAPRLELKQDNTLLAANTGWSTAADPLALVAAANATGAFPLSAGSGDSALLITLPPGSYTALVSSAGGDSGIALAEIYELASDAATPGLVNLSTRARAGVGENAIITGFVVDGSENKTLLVRAAGPALAAFDVTDVLSRPHLALHNADGAIVAQNAGWSASEDAPAIAEAADRAGAFAFAADSADAALLVTLAPGTYTAQVTGADGGTGTTLVEVYELP